MTIITPRFQTFANVSALGHITGFYGTPGTAMSLQTLLNFAVMDKYDQGASIVVVLIESLPESMRSFNNKTEGVYVGGRVEGV